jgi:hypothetical protein
VPNAAKAVDTNLDGHMVSVYRSCIEGWPSEASSGASTRRLGGNAETSEITQSGLHNLIGLPSCSHSHVDTLVAHKRHSSA